MVAVTTNPLHLWPRGPHAGRVHPLGSIRITELDAPWSGDGGLRMGIEYRPPESETEPRRLVELKPTVGSAWPTRRTYGRVLMLSDPLDQRDILGTQTTTHWWVWSLTMDEIETIEAERVPNAAAEVVQFNLDVAGVATIGSETWGFRGEIQFSLATADWLSLLRSLGYATPPSLQGLAGRSLTVAPSWGWAHEKISEARRHLALGEDREALRSAYLVLDAISANPYKAQWDEVLGDPDLPDEKADVIRRLLQAQAQVLSKLGRHPSWGISDGRDRTMLPLDHWEAELAIALTQLLLAAAERWRTVREAHAHERPAAESSDS
jgi:hypothetical protein